jgi:Capsule assembly protein Wzi
MRILFIIFLLSSASNLFAQSNEIKREIKYTAEAETIISSNGETPFWLRANQYGTVPNQSPIFTLRGSISSDYKKAITKEDQYKLSKFDWGFGLNIVGNVGKENQFLIPEAYLKAKYGAFEIYAGRRKELFGLVDSTLSSGSYIWSGNALPMPKIQISTPNFVPLGFTKGFLSFKGNYAHGWFENSRTDVKNFYLHQKSLYFRLGKSDWKFHFYGGFNHQVQWGGELLYPDPTGYLSKDGKLPSSFQDYIRVIIGKSLATESDTSKFAGADAGNRGGNHLGTLDFGFDVTLDNIKMLVYRQSIYEDGSLFYLNNISDGLNGISFTNISPSNKINITNLSFEFLNTYSQGGNYGGDQTNSRLRGQDFYLNHGQYIDGWSYLRNGIGTPFISNVINKDIPQSSLLFNNDRLQAVYLGVVGNINNLTFDFRVSHTKSLGSYLNKISYPYEMISSKLTFGKQIERFENVNILAGVSFDSGNLFNNTLGIMVSVKKSW